MDLIDRSKLEAFCTTCKSQDYMDGVKDTLERIDNLPTVDAIPVEWLSKLADECAKDKDPYVEINGLLINVVINRWEERTGETE